MTYCYGLKPVQVQPLLRLANYYTSDLPKIGDLKFPFGNADLIKPEMFCNDTLGDCAIAGSIEEVRLANALAGKTVNFTDETAIKNYSAITGYKPDDPSTDQGTDVHELYQYRKATGIVDADGNHHKIKAYAGLTPGDWDELLIALWLFPSGVGIGIDVPDNAQQQFEAGQPWHLTRGHHSIEGGHYIPIVDAVRPDQAGLFTWGAHGGIMRTFYEKYNTVAAVALTEEMFTDGKSPTGIELAKLAADVPALNTGQVESKAPPKIAV